MNPSDWGQDVAERERFRFDGRIVVGSVVVADGVANGIVQTPTSRRPGRDQVSGVVEAEQFAFAFPTLVGR